MCASSSRRSPAGVGRAPGIVPRRRTALVLLPLALLAAVPAGCGDPGVRWWCENNVAVRYDPEAHESDPWFRDPCGDRKCIESGDRAQCALLPLHPCEPALQDPDKAPILIRYCDGGNVIQCGIVGYGEYALDFCEATGRVCVLDGLLAGCVLPDEPCDARSGNACRDDRTLLTGCFGGQREYAQACDLAVEDLPVACRAFPASPAAGLPSAACVLDLPCADGEDSVCSPAATTALGCGPGGYASQVRDRCPPGAACRMCPLLGATCVEEGAECPSRL